jgi:uncharacterized protein (UPF0332 family)
MKNTFLIKLHKEGKLQIVEPNDNIKDSYIKKSESNLVSAKILLQNQKLEESVYLAYYSMYNMLTALLFKTGIKCENHTAAIILLKEIFGISNSNIDNAKKERVDKQYYTDFSIMKEDVKTVIEQTEEFNNELLDFISKLNNSMIEEFRRKFEILVY